MAVQARSNNVYKQLQSLIPLAHDVTDLLNLFLAASLLSRKDCGVMGRVFPSGGFVHTRAGVLQFVLRAVSVGVHVSSWLPRLRRTWGDFGIVGKGPTLSGLQKEKRPDYNSIPSIHTLLGTC